MISCSLNGVLTVLIPGYPFKTSNPSYYVAIFPHNDNYVLKCCATIRPKRGPELIVPPQLYLKKEACWN